MIWMAIAWFVASLGWAMYVCSRISNAREVVSLLDMLMRYENVFNIYRKICPEENDNEAIVEAKRDLTRMLIQHSDRYAS